MHLGAKKFDRYILPAHLPLITLAGLGWVCPGLADGRKTRLAAEYALPAVCGRQPVRQPVQRLPLHPQLLQPAHGRAAKGPRSHDDRLGRRAGPGSRLPQQHAAERQTAGGGRLWHRPACPSISTGSIIHEPNVVNMENEWGPQNADKLRHADYLVLYVNQWQRGLRAAAAGLLAQVEPEHTVVINQIEYARLLPPGRPAATRLPGAARP